MRKGFQAKIKVGGQEVKVGNQFKISWLDYQQRGRSRIDIISRATQTMAAVVKLRTNKNKNICLE